MKAIAAAVVLAWAAVASPARAVEREQHFGVDLGGGLLVIGNKSTSDLGATAMVHYAYGLSDAFNLMVEAATRSWRSVRPPTARRLRTRTPSRSPTPISGSVTYSTC